MFDFIRKPFRFLKRLNESAKKMDRMESNLEESFSRLNADVGESKDMICRLLANADGSKDIIRRLELEIHEIKLLTETDKALKKCEDQKEVLRRAGGNWKIWRNDFFINDIVNNKADFDSIYDALGDEKSRDTFSWLITYRFLIPIFGETELWATEEPSFLYGIMPGGTGLGECRRTYEEAKKKNGELCLHIENYAYWHTFVLGAYKHDELFQYKEGDVVFDIGAYAGDTALFFSRLIGAAGKVYAFEGSKRVVDLIYDNIKHFSANNIEVVNKAVSDKDGRLFFAGDDSGGHISEGEGEEVECVTIDTFCAENGIDKLDLIKMDIEGAELDALKGGVNAIKKFRPVLLISVYHKRDYGYGDLLPVSKYLMEICEGYSFYLRHKNCSLWETTMICVPGK